MSSPDPALIFAFVALIGGLVAYVAVFALLTTYRKGAGKSDAPTEEKDETTAESVSLHSQRILDLQPRVHAPPSTAR